MAGDLTRILSRLIESTGPISLSHFMGEANTHYYSSRDPLGSDGDFTTAPEISQMFGEMVGIWLADMWLRSNGQSDKDMDSPSNRPAYVELGPGRGTLANDALRTMAQFNVAPEVHFIEGSPVLREMQSAIRPDATWHDSVETLPNDRPLLIVANEFFDALPIRQLVATHAGWRERVVVRDGDHFMPLPGSRPMDAAVPETFANAPAGSILETCPAASGIAFEIAGRLAAQGGVLLVIDYGYEQDRLGSSLQAVWKHDKVDPFVDPGERDLTAHVNFAELARMAQARDAHIDGPVDQGTFLKALGIEARANLLMESAPEQQDTISQALQRLVDDDQMGSLFKVMAVRSAGWPEPEGFGKA